MYKIRIDGFEKIYLLEEMIKIFLKPDEYHIYNEKNQIEEVDFHFNKELSTDKNKIKREIYTALSQLKKSPHPWGILTGIRPVKFWGETFGKLGRNMAYETFKNDFFVSEEKLKLIEDIFSYQVDTIGYADSNSSIVYIGIPFCPTRCLYCSFVSNQKGDEEIERYFKSLLIEIESVGQMMKEKGKSIESLYIGGGTPTTLSGDQLNDLLENVNKNLPMNQCKEITVEAGRPDTITKEKLEVLKSRGVTRISINPQSMKSETLEIVGRSHTVDMIRESFKIAKEIGFESINADLIAGLPEESPDDFRNSLKEVIDLNPDNITVHCLAVKRASRLVDVDADFHYKQAETVSEMLNISKEILEKEGYKPYYLYRQKNMAGAFENIGYCRDNKVNIYNMRIMDEHIDVISLGAGGISKVYFPAENRLERIPNVSSYKDYIARIDEMIDRKRRGFFKEVENAN